MKRSSSLDCHSIGQSLKRVKIATSPGELRLDRDIESLVWGKRWTSTAAHNPRPIDNGWPRRNNASSPRGSRIHGELFCHNARLVRDPVDPLRLRLTYLHPPMMAPNNKHMRSSSPLPPERWTFLIRMPRMYPHVPPAITRVTRDFVPNNENIAHLGNMNVDYSASAAILANSAMQSQVEPPVPEQITIHPLPPTPNSGFHGANEDGTKISDIDLATSVINTWSPVSSLQDLIDFLTGIPARRREWWGVENNRKHHQQQRRFLGYHVGGTTPMGQPTIAPASSILDARQHQHNQPFHQPKQHQQHQQHQFSSSHCDMEHDGDMNIVESMMEDGRRDFSGGRHANPFTENRFDVGYPKPCRQWGVR
mmetsp:Transcript_29977/g.56681  ORF Transcript_29977/g.56681 Transcript_29977/m.56681 type:complete len:365 (+) Transcript_29977:231-1325(+)